MVSEVHYEADSSTAIVYTNNNYIFIVNMRTDEYNIPKLPKTTPSDMDSVQPLTKNGQDVSLDRQSIPAFVVSAAWSGYLDWKYNRDGYS